MSDLTNLEPHKVLNLPIRGFTIHQLRNNYKLLARQLHPDKRPNGMTPDMANQTFQVITSAYRQLVEQLQSEESESMSFHDLRNNSRNAIKESKQTKTKPNTKFNSKRFNKVFEDNKVSDPVYDYGYETWMNQTNPGDETLEENMQIINAADLKPLTLGKTSAATPFTELGVIAVKDYSGTDYTDYKLAHSTRALAREDEFANQDRPELKSVDTLRRYRAESYAPLTEEDAAKEADRKQMQEHAEQQRIENLRTYDNLMFSTHDRISRLMLKNN